MEFIPKNPILDFTPDQMNSVRKEYNLDKPGDMNRAIDGLEAWIKQQIHFKKKKLPRNYLEKALISSKGSIERTKNKLDKIYTFRTMMPNFFGDNLTKNKFDDLDVVKSGLLPQPTPENYRIYVIKTTGSTFTSELILNYYKYAILVNEYLMAYDYSNGYVLVIDYNEANIMEIVKAFNVTDLRQIISIIIEGFGLRLKGIHFLTQSKTIDAFVTIMKQFISAKLAKRICVHKDINTLYEHVPKDILPVEYGGKEKSLVKLCDELKNEVTRKDFIKYIEEMNEAKTDESFRCTDKFNEQYSGMSGSFRTLNVD